SIGSDALDAHSFCDLACLLPARHLAEGFEMFRVLPGLGLLLVAFGTGIRTVNHCWLVGNGVSCGDSAGHQHAAEGKGGRPQGSPGSEPVRSRAKRGTMITFHPCLSHPMCLIGC